MPTLNTSDARGFGTDQPSSLIERSSATAPTITSVAPVQGQTALSFADASAAAANEMKNGALSKFDTQLAALYFSQSTDAVRMSAFTDGVQQFTNAITPDGQYVVIDAIAQDGNGAALLDQLQAMGLKGGASFKGMASGYMPISNLAMLTTADNLSSVRESAFASSVGNVTTQADHNQRDDVARSTYGVDGTGLRVGVLSDSFDMKATGTDHMAQNIASNDLPASTHVLQDAFAAATDEGRAMAQLVHDIAPGAGIDFHTGNGGQANFAQGILDLAAAGDKVIVDDLSYFAELTYQNGVIAQAINQVVGQGVSYFSSAGNDSSVNTTAGTVLGTPAGQLMPTGYQGDWVTGATNVTINGITYASLMRFDSGASQDYLSVKTSSQATQFFTLTWDNPGASAGGLGATSDLDVYLENSTGTTLLAGSFSSNINGDPVEVFAYSGTNASARIVVALKSGPAPTNIRLHDSGNGLNNIGFQAVSSNQNVGTLSGHHATAGNIAVGAVPFYKAADVTENDPSTGLGAFNPPVSETFSSLGKQTLYFDDNGNPMTHVTYGVDFSAVDGGNTTFFTSDTVHDSDTNPNFFGTSAAAPDAAATGVLLLSANSGLTSDDVRALLIDSTIPMASTVQSGAGFIQADKAVGFVVNHVISNPLQTTLYGTHFDETINGGSSADTLYGNAGNDTINGNDGADTIYGGTGNDTIAGNAGNDTIFGDAGNDTLLGGQGDDIVNGGAGDDVIAGNLGNDTLNGGVGFDTVTYNSGNITSGVVVSLGSGGAGTATGGAGNDTLYNFDQVIGTNFNDSITGSPGNDVLQGLAGSDTLHGGTGDDTLEGGSGAETQFANTVDQADLTKLQAVDNGSPANAFLVKTGTGAGAPATDFDLIANPEVEQATTLPHATIHATSDGTHDDYYVFTVAAGASAVFDIDHYGLDANGNDSVIRLFDTDGTTQLAFNDDDYADPGSLTYDSRLAYTFASAGTYYLRVEGFQNSIPSAGHTYTLNISLSSATVVPDGTFTTGHDIIDGGDGNDTASYANAPSAVTVSLLTQGVGVTQNTGGAGIDELQSIENLTGSAFNDTLTGDANANILSGGNGNDTLNGGDGNDTLNGDAGADNLAGGVGNDTLNGGADGDQLSGGKGNDTISGGDGNDSIYGNLDADTLTGGAGADTFFYVTANDSTAASFDTITDFQTGSDKVNLLAVGAGSYVISTSGGMTYIDVDIGANGSNDMHIAFTGTDVVTTGDVLFNGPGSHAAVNPDVAGQIIKPTYVDVIAPHFDPVAHSGGMAFGGTLMV